MLTAIMTGLCGVALVPLLCAASQARNEDERDDWLPERRAMVAVVRQYGIKDERILRAMAKIRRHRFIPAAFRDRHTSYADHPTPIGSEQTISQPYIVAYMTEKLGLQPGEKVLEIGTGSGYQAALLAELGAKVYSIELIPALAEHARQVLAAEGYASVKVLTGDGYKGWPEYAPFDAVIATCAPDDVPQPLVDQLREGGRMIVPVGTGFQRLVILKKVQGKIDVQDDLPVRFVPMVKGP